MADQPDDDDKRTLGDMLHTAIKIGVSGIPVVGGPITEVVNLVPPPAEIKRRAREKDTISRVERLEAVTGSVEEQRMVRDDAAQQARERFLAGFGDLPWKFERDGQELLVVWKHPPGWDRETPEGYLITLTHDETFAIVSAAWQLSDFKPQESNKAAARFLWATDADRGSRVRIKPFSQYQPTNITFPLALAPRNNESEPDKCLRCRLYTRGEFCPVCHRGVAELRAELSR